MKTLRLLTLGLSAALVLSLSLSGASAIQEAAAPTRAPDVIFVPTPEAVVKAMLKLANVKKGELVYDLGCGDGRAVIAAARDFGARGIGVDIDPARIQESKANAADAGVTDRVEFKQADLFELNFADADVVFLYLLPSLNLKLRPRILDELRPGTRVVSHSFSMDDWKADETQHPSGRTVYYWVVPAKVQGTWHVKLPDGSQGVLALEQKFQTVTGTVTANGQTLPIKDGRLKGTELTLVFGEGPNSGLATFTVAGNQLNGNARRGASGTQEKWAATMAR